MSSLMQRLLTAAVLVPIVVWVVLYSPEFIFLFVLSLIVFIGAYEWSGLAEVENSYHKFIVAGFILAVSNGLLLIDAELLTYLMLLSLVFWLLVIVFIVFMPAYLLAVKRQRMVMLVLGSVLLSLTFVSLFQLRHAFTHGADLLMYLLLLIWIADSGAYFAGRTLGRNKLSAVISPGKSIEGVVGGLLTCLLFAVLAAGYFEVASIIGFIFLSLFVVIVSVYGDLFESLLKRRAAVKDSGHILPGHGGVLDRIDSLIAAGPVFYGCLLLTEMVA